jgi:hypothetical protein
MFCDGCKQELEEKLFLMNQKKCYKCIYKEKLELSKKKSNFLRCKNCKKRFLLKKGGRRSHCSQECATAYWKRQQREFWARKAQRDYPMSNLSGY